MDPTNMESRREMGKIGMSVFILIISLLATVMGFILRKTDQFAFKIMIYGIMGLSIGFTTLLLSLIKLRKLSRRK